MFLKVLVVTAIIVVCVFGLVGYIVDTYSKPQILLIGMALSALGLGLSGISLVCERHNHIVLHIIGAFSIASSILAFKFVFGEIFK